MKIALVVLIGLFLVVPAYAEDHCGRVAPRLSFCGDLSVWTIRETDAPDITAAYRRGPTFRAQLIDGRLGSDDGMTAERLLRFQREVYAEYAETDLAAIAVLEEAAVEVGGRNATRQSFLVPTSSGDYVITLTAVVLSDYHVQVMTLQVTDRMTRRHRKWHQDFVDLTRIHDAAERKK